MIQIKISTVAKIDINSYALMITDVNCFLSDVQYDLLTNLTRIFYIYQAKELSYNTSLCSYFDNSG